MCNFLLKLGESRRNQSKTQENDGVVSVNESTSNSKNLFSHFYEKNNENSFNSEKTDFVEKYLDKIEDKTTPVEVQSEIQETIDVIKNDSSTTNLDKSLLLIKESLNFLNLSINENTSEVLNNSHYVLLEFYNKLLNHSQKKEFINKTHESLSLEDSKNVESINQNKEIFLNKMNLSLNNLTENKTLITEIKSKLNSMIVNEVFIYSSEMETKNKIKNNSKKLYDIFKTVQKDLNTDIKNEFWSLLQFSKNTSNYKVFVERVSKLENSFTKYTNELNSIYNDYLLKK